jgi:hypothetical protein
MRLALTFAAALLSAVTGLSSAQTFEKTEELMKLQTSFLVLKDGERIVVRGGYEFKDGLVVFYYNRGRNPVFSSIDAEMVDLSATEAANKKLLQERERHRMYLLLLEERQKRLLEGVEQGPVVIRSEAGELRVSEAAVQGERVAPAGAEEIPVLTLEDATNRDEAWWREQAAILFAALRKGNVDIAALEGQYQDLIFRINRSGTEAEAAPLKAQLNDVQGRIIQERRRANYIGARLGDLSAFAEELGIPLDWLLPTDFPVLNETPDAASTQGLPRSESESTGEIISYSAEDLADVEDGWWAEERLRLERLIDETGISLEGLQIQYNDLVKQRNEAVSDLRKNQISEELDKVESAIRGERSNLESARAALDRLFLAARELGKEEMLGMLKQEGEEIP